MLRFLFVLYGLELDAVGVYAFSDVAKWAFLFKRYKEKI
jgi:hypothetical protein